MCESVSSNTQYTQKGPQSKAKARNGTEKDVSTMFVNPAEQVVRRSKLGHIGPGTNHQNVKRIRNPPRKRIRLREMSKTMSARTILGTHAMHLACMEKWRP
jgi:hypothetical protein